VPLLLAVPDLLVLYAGLLLGYKIRLGEWLLPHTTEWGIASHLVLGVFVVALGASGIYRLSPRLMHLSEFIRVGLWLIGAWAVSITLTYAVDPADVRDSALMGDLFTRLQPDVVLHTAAYKHVPLMERHPAEAFRNNTEASVNLLTLCEQHEVDQFVFVSTDKAVNPSSVLGATKQLAEWYVRTGTGAPQCRTVRFGNVFGTQGSVVPRFEEKLADGEPLPITHPEMERYFMSSEEACGLILQTLLLNAHPTYIFRMGDPVSIQWLAERLINHWYPHVDPETMIEYVGRRPGEKMSEELVADDETVHPTDHPSIVGLEAPVPHPRPVLDAHLQRLQSVASPTYESREQLRTLLLKTQPDDQTAMKASSPGPSSIDHP
jgi:FlaA1/EpsC-like NDP-sugar epimerase